MTRDPAAHLGDRIQASIGSMDRAARFVDPSVIAISYTIKFPTADGRRWKVTVQPDDPGPT